MTPQAKSNHQTSPTTASAMLGDPWTPRRIVQELDRFIVGQEEAKRAIAVALRNRWRRRQVDESLREEILPKNILLIGPTGVGKTEIARRVARMLDAPFVKVEATKFTEVGYVGRDVESIVRELVETSVAMLHHERVGAVQDQAAAAAVQRLADLLVEQQEAAEQVDHVASALAEQDEEARRKREVAIKRRLARRRNRVLSLLNAGTIEDETVEIDVDAEVEAYLTPSDLTGAAGPETMQEAITELLGNLGSRRYSRSVSVREARRILTQQEAEKLIDPDALIEEAIQRAEDAGIVFIDELDKTVNPSSDYGPDVSGEGVQRDLLPIVDGSVVMTRFGPVRTHHMLFIAAGSFHSARPTDLIPELQGRFPIRAELDSLDEDDLYAILADTENALTRQYAALLQADGVAVEFDDSGLREIAHMAALVNARTENIGARRLHTIVERVLEDLLFDAPEQAVAGTVCIDRAYVDERIGDIVADEDLSNFIL